MEITQKEEFTIKDLMELEVSVMEYLYQNWDYQSYNPSLSNLINDFKLATDDEMTILLSVIISLSKSHAIEFMLCEKNTIRVAEYNTTAGNKVDHTTVIVDFLKRYFIINENVIERRKIKNGSNGRI